MSEHIDHQPSRDHSAETRINIDPDLYDQLELYRIYLTEKGVTDEEAFLDYELVGLSVDSMANAAIRASVEGFSDGLNPSPEDFI